MKKDEKKKPYKRRLTRQEVIERERQKIQRMYQKNPALKSICNMFDLRIDVEEAQKNY